MCEKTKEFIEKARIVHGDRYDYSKVKYVGYNKKVTITCPDHGDFEQKLNEHKYGSGCPKCFGKVRVTNETTLEQFREVQGDRYDYSKINCINTKTKVTITCLDHGDFEQTPNNHKQGNGCPKCRGLGLTAEELIKQFREVHGNRYDYSKLNYVNSRTKVTIICPDHGDFEQTSNHHKQGKGCPKCCGLGLTAEELIKQFREVHGNRYDYSKVNYIDANAKITITCLNHGDFEQTPYTHKNGSGCPKCSGRDLTAEEVIEQFREIHGDRYDYSKVKYVKARTKVTIICPNHGDFEQTPNSHKNGNGCPSCRGTKWLAFKVARDYVRGLGLTTHKQWVEWAKSSERPANVPASPFKVYRGIGWVSMGDWLGTGVVSTRKITYRPFEEARDFVRGLGLTTISEWRDWVKTTNRPVDIPTSPHSVYRDSGWLSIPDWLGTKVGFDGFLPFEDAKEYVRGLKISSSIMFEGWAKSKSRPTNIPAHPYTVYKNNGWSSFADFLGYIGDGNHRWDKHVILDYIKSLKSELVQMDAIELITVINSNNLAKKIRELGSLEELLSTQCGTTNRINVVDRLIEELETSSGEDTDDSEGESTVTIEPITIDLTESEIDDTDVTIEIPTLEPLEPIQELHMLDNNMITASLDDENVDFLIKNRLKKLWNSVLNNEVDLESFRREEGGDNFTILKNMFFDEYDTVTKIQPPSDYIFKYPPNLMQKLMAYRLMNEKRYGNWSGTGAGKTLSAIFAGRLANAKNTVIIGNNANVEGWVKSIHEYFANSNVFTKTLLVNTPKDKYNVVDKYEIHMGDAGYNYLVLNYEAFQLGDGDYIISELLKNNTIDYIILDEVQNVKQRDEDNQSTRRDVINKLVIHASENNENLLVMAMSATPVINNLTEPKKLIELITGEAHDDLDTRDTITNGIEMYKALTRYGLRYKPKYGISVTEHIVESDGTHLSDLIISTNRGAVVENEKLLLETKLDSVKGNISKGTLIYTHYVTELCDIIGDYVSNLGLKVGFYTGGDKTGLQSFINGDIDVLVGSAPISTGVDGIQKVCDTLIPLVLPWTSSEYDQLVGRVNRQGSNFDKVNIYVPQVIIPLEGDNIWSWDRRRYNIIRFKATLADLAVDGNIPRSLLPSRDRLLEQAKEELSEWVNRLNRGEIITFQRESLTIPLNPVQLERSRTQLGDFSDLNRRWSVTNSTNTHKRLSEDPTEWYYYHTLYSEKRQSWSEIPYIEIANKIKVRPDWVVGDFGCGENLLSKEIGNKVYAFDHVAIDDTVYACDINNVPIEDNMLDVAVFSLSLMGSNHTDYFKEAYRTLKIYGNIFVCEPASKWDGREEELKNQIESVGFKCFGAIRNTDKFIYIDGVKY